MSGLYTSESRGVIGVKLVMQMDSGWPDRLYLAPGGRVVFAEFKKGGADLSDRQAHIRKLLTAFGFQVRMARNKKQTVLDVLAALGLKTKGSR